LIKYSNQPKIEPKQVLGLYPLLSYTFFSASKANKISPSIANYQS